MWAGPLAAWLLGRLGAEVVKVEAPFRPDGTRALHGPGVRPGDRPRCPGADSGIFNALSTGKTSVVLDARSSSGRAELEGLLEGCDVVIEAFSPRVIPNLGLGACRDGQGRKAGSVWVSIPAFPSGPERDYVAYGNGIHAASGLGNDGRGGYQSPAVTYVDPVAGFGACRAALGALAGGSFLKPTAWIEVSLWSAVQPLLRRPPAPLVPPPASLGADLLQKAVIEGGAEVVRDGAGTHWYPRGPWRGGTWDLPLGPPPAWAPVEGRT
jgi:crotonobetainyl-CoA:carnitine CoA-transferase CaiB-like acyl-CoA transferase